MSESRVFKLINRINSILFLLILLGLGGFIAFLFFQSSDWRERRTVEVAAGDEQGEKDNVEFILGRVEQVAGHDSQYVQLSSRIRGGKLSGYSGGETRNVLFFVGTDLDSHWIFDHNQNLISTIATLHNGNKCNNTETVKAIYFNVVVKDTNGDGKLSGDDLSVVALARPDGTGYTELVSDVKSVFDFNISDDGMYLMLLHQIENEVIFSRYSIKDFSRVSRRVVTGITKKP
jgi:hypothetical protein